MVQQSGYNVWQWFSSEHPGYNVWQWFSTLDTMYGNISAPWIRVRNLLIEFWSELLIFCQKSEQMSNSLKKVRNSLICSFLVSNLSNLLTIAHSFWATWANRSEGVSETFTCFKNFKKNCKNLQKIRLFQIFFSKSLIFASKREKWAICSKKPRD